MGNVLSFEEYYKLALLISNDIVCRTVHLQLAYQRIDCLINFAQDILIPNPTRDLVAENIHKTLNAIS